METKLWAALCALLLLVSSGSSDQSENQTAPALTPGSAPSTEAGPGTTAAYFEPRTAAAGPNSSDPNLNGTGRWSNNTETPTGPEVIAVASTPAENGTSTTQPPSQHPHPTSAIHPSASHTSGSTSTIGSTPLAHTLSVDLTTTSSPDYNASRTSAPVLPDISPTQLNQSIITSSPTVPTSPPSKPEHTSAAFLPHATSPSSVSPHQPRTSPSPPHTTSPDSHPETTTQAQPKSSTAKSPSAPSAQAKTHTDTPSQRNVEHDPTMVRDSSTLDPLLAGLVSAFIITAVIITLLLFLKLRRRDNRPEFRRLQDLPMDDMMEDTPLSMYSY